MPLGADGMGCDVLARVAHGAVSTISMAVITTFLALCIGLVAGAALRLMAGPIEISKPTPPVIAGLIVAALMGPSSIGAMIAVLAVGWAPLAAHVAALLKQAQAIDAEITARHVETEHRRLALVAKQLRIAIEVERFVETGSAEACSPC